MGAMNLSVNLNNVDNNVSVVRVESSNTSVERLIVELNNNHEIHLAAPLYGVTIFRKGDRFIVIENDRVSSMDKRELENLLKVVLTKCHWIYIIKP